MAQPTHYLEDNLIEVTRGLEGEASGKLKYHYACLGSVEYRTNGYKGGDGGHGGFLEVVIDTEGGSTNMEMSVDGRNLDYPGKIVLRYLGDQEMRTAMLCFKFLGDELERVLRQSDTTGSYDQHDRD